jgi:hypothetical protein
VVKNSPGNSTGSAGGFVGRNQNGSIISNTYAAGTLTVDGAVGGFAGSNEIQNTDSGKIFNSYWDLDVSAQNIAIPNNQANAINTQVNGLTSTQIRQSSSFPGWDFSSVWIIEEGVTRPLLRSYAVTTALPNTTTTPDRTLKVYFSKENRHIHFDESTIEVGTPIRIITLDGRVAMNRIVSQSSLDVSALNPGVYIIELKTKQGQVKSSKIIII